MGFTHPTEPLRGNPEKGVERITASVYITTRQANPEKGVESKKCALHGVVVLPTESRKGS